MKTIILIFTILSFSTFAKEKKESIAFQINTEKGFCSATLLKVGGVCKLVTNAHCLNNNENEVAINSASTYFISYDEEFADGQNVLVNIPTFKTKDALGKHFLWKYEKRYFSDSEYQLSKTKVLAVDRTKDLALLEVPNEMKAKSCKNLANVWEANSEKIAQEDASVVIAGFTTNKTNSEPHPKVWHNKDTYFRSYSENTPEFVNSPISLETSTLENVDKFLVVEGIKMLPGNSGGMAQNETGLFLGVTTRFHPTEDKVYIIPASDVIDYVINPTNSDSSKDIENTTQHVSGNGGTDGSGNGGTDGSGNGGTDGSGNGGTDGSGNGGTDGSGNGGTDGSGCAKFGAKDIFTEPYEGYLNQFGEIILAINGNQIDGSNDLKDHLVETGVIVKRDADGYPSLEDRKNTLIRLTGNFEFDSVQKFYRQDDTHVQGWEEYGYFMGFTELNVNDKLVSIDLKKHFQHYSPANSSHLSNFHDQSKHDFKVSYSDDYKTITLKQGSRTLSCDNRNYLKLICEGSGYSLSISRDSLNPGAKTKYRFTKSEGGEHRFHFFGENR